MTKSLHIRVPEPIMKQIEKIETDEDKNKTNVVIDLLELGLLSKQNNQDIKFNELQSECSTLQIINIVKLIADLYRMNFDPKKSKYVNEASDVDSALRMIKEEAKVFVEAKLSEPEEN